MKALLPISGLLIALLGPVGSGYAQYLFLDTNGDSSSTTMDGLSTLVPTEIDVWICTNANRDGSKAIAATRSEVPLSIFSYEFILHATGGTIEWMKYTNLQPGMDFNAGEREGDADGLGISASGIQLASELGPPLRFGVQIAPNPLNPDAVITVTTTLAGYLRVRVFDTGGRLVRTLQDSPSLPAGQHKLSLRADAHNKRSPQGFT